MSEGELELLPLDNEERRDARPLRATHITPEEVAAHAELVRGWLGPVAVWHRYGHPSAAIVSTTAPRASARILAPPCKPHRLHRRVQAAKCG